MKKAFAILVTLLALTGVLSAQIEGKSQGPIRVGAILPLSGVLAKLGQGPLNGMILALEQINAQGGVLGRPLEILFEDDEAWPRRSVEKYRHLVDEEKVSWILGAFTSKSTLAIAPLAKKDGVVLITPTATEDSLNNFPGTVFRTCYFDSYHGRIMANFAFKNLGLRSIRILTDESLDFSKAMGQLFKKTFEALGGQVVPVFYTSGSGPQGPQSVNKDANDPVQGLFIPSYYDVMMPKIGNLNSSGIIGPLFGAGAWDEILRQSPPSPGGSFFSHDFWSTSPEPLVRKFVEDYQTRFGTAPSDLAALGYDSVKVLAQALTLANTTDREKVRAALYKVQGRFVTGDLRFTPEGQTEKSAVVLKIIQNAGGSNVEYQATVNP